jgi:hypothetical protein
MKRVRFLVLMVSLSPCLWAGDDAVRDIVRKAIQVDARNAELQHGYIYLMREETREQDGVGKDKRVTIRTVEISMMNGSPYRKLVARNDQPISLEEQKLEQDKLQFTLEQRQKESSGERQRRIADFRRREEKRREPLHELPDAYDFKLVGDETMNGAECWVIDATPKPGYKPKASTSSVLTVLAGRMWISKKDYGWVKVDMEARDSFTIGGFLLRLSKGSRIIIEQTCVGDGVWLPQFVEVQFSARLLMLKSLREDMKWGFTDYRKPQPLVGMAATQR